MPRSQSQPPESELGDLPGFSQVGEADPGDHPDEPTPTAEGQTTTSPPPAETPPPAEGVRAEDSGRSFPVSISHELSEELENFSGGVFELAGLFANRVVKARTHRDTRLWLVTEEEADDFGAAAGRILARRVPAELAEGDGADALIMGSVVLGYSMRNLTGVQAPAPAGAIDVPSERSASVQVAEAPPPPPPAAAAPAASMGGRSPVVGVEAATPPPPFSPDL